MATLPPITVDILNTQAFRDFVAHADTVATKLVEVICDLDADLDELVRDVRAQIAADIESGAGAYRERFGPPQTPIQSAYDDGVRDGYAAAAKLARGVSA